MVKSCVITIGNFDGVHCGHRAILARAGTIAKNQGRIVKALTFDPHPAQVLRPGTAPPRLTSLDAKRRYLLDAGATHVEVLEPTDAMLSLSAEAFVTWLVEQHQPSTVVEGADFRFGAGRTGDITLLTALGKQHGFDVEVVESVEVALADHQIAPVRSSFIRWLIEHGRVADAGICLGRLFSINGVVVKGEQRGRTIGVPTANLDAADLAAFALPKDGVYAGVVEVATQAGNASLAAAISVGTKPTFANNERVVEAHLLDYNDDLYGQTISVYFARWLRDQSPFPGLDALKEQLGRDIDTVRSLASNTQLTEPLRASACP